MQVQSVARGVAAHFPQGRRAARRFSCRASSHKSLGISVLLVTAVLILPVPASRAQINSSVGGVNLNAVVNPSLAINVSPTLVNFQLVPNGVANGDASLNIITAWVLRPNVGDVRLYAYFSAPASALSDGFGNNIPSARVRGSVNGGGYSPFTGSGPFAAGSGLLVFTERVLGNNRNKTRVDTLNLQIDITGMTLPAGTYTGVLRLQAQAL